MIILKKKNKKAFEMSFAMIFSIIAGAIIIFLAIYAASKFIDFGKKTHYSEAALALTNLFDASVNGIGIASATRIDFKRETRLYIGCAETSSRSPYFGKQDIAFSEESGLIQKWSPPGENISRYNKYIFSNNVEQGKTLYIFSKSLYFGYKVDDLIFLTMNNYCFVAPPESISSEVGGMAVNINITPNLNGCSKNSIKVCFGFADGRCNMSVYGECNDANCKDQYETGRVVKNGQTMAYAGSLIYGAIFSSKNIYSCNLKRLGKKTAELAELYNDKIEIIQRLDCSSTIGSYLSSIISISQNLTDSKIANLNNQAKLMDEENCNQVICRMYRSESCIT